MGVCGGGLEGGLSSAVAFVMLGVGLVTSVSRQRSMHPRARTGWLQADKCRCALVLMLERNQKKPTALHLRLVDPS